MTHFRIMTRPDGLEWQHMASQSISPSCTDHSELSGVSPLTEIALFHASQVTLLESCNALHASQKFLLLKIILQISMLFQVILNFCFWYSLTAWNQRGVWHPPWTSMHSCDSFIIHSFHIPLTLHRCGTGHVYIYSGVPRNFVRRGFNKFRWGQRERGSGGSGPLVRGSGGSCNLVQEISFHIVKFS
jgi:hypothetical protein